MRRAPKSADQSAFLFDNLIDYKSFEFLAKLFKITEKLLEYDDEMLIMNLWYKLVENQRQNYEILAKFLLHTLTTAALKQSKPFEYEKSKRYALNILNFIKVRM